MLKGILQQQMENVLMLKDEKQMRVVIQRMQRGTKLQRVVTTLTRKILERKHHQSVKPHLADTTSRTSTIPTPSSSAMALTIQTAPTPSRSIGMARLPYTAATSLMAQRQKLQSTVLVECQ